MPKFIVQHEQDEGEFDTLCEREYGDSVPVPEKGDILEIPEQTGDDGEPVTYFVENLGHRLEDDGPVHILYVRDEEQVRQQIRERRKQEMRRMQKMQQQQQQMGGGGGGGGQGSGGGSPFTLG